jgi:hypothetical protein
MCRVVPLAFSLLISTTMALIISAVVWPVKVLLRF